MKKESVYELVDFDELARQTERAFAWPGRVVVSMNRAKNAVATDDGNLEMFTPSVSGCTVVAIVGRTADGTRKAFLSHYDPLSVLKQGDGIEQFITEAGFVTGRAFLTMPHDEPARMREGVFQDMNRGYLETLLWVLLGKENVHFREYDMFLGFQGDCDVRMIVRPDDRDSLATISAHGGFTAPL